MITDGLTWNTLVGGISLLGILAVLSYAAIMQGNHDALVSLISLVTGAGIAGSAISSKPPSVIVKTLDSKDRE